MVALDRQARGNLEQERLPSEEQEVGKEQPRKAQLDNSYLTYGFRQKRMLSYSRGKSLFPNHTGSHTPFYTIRNQLK